MPRLRRGEIPGIRGETWPYASIVLVVLGIVGTLLWRTTLVDKANLVIAGKPTGHWWHVLTAAFTYDNAGLAFAVLGTTAVYGWLLERRHGPLPVLMIFLVGAVGGMAATAVVYQVPVALGGSGGALALLTAWAVPHVMALREGQDIEADLIGTIVIGVVVAVMPVADPNSPWLADAVGVLTGLVLGVPLALARPL